jgi:hypothetical protein
MAAKPGLLERVGVRALERRAARVAAPSAVANPVHLLDDGERAALRRIERACVIRSGIAGALSGLAAAVAEALVVEHQQSDPVYFWVVVGVVAGIAAIAELWFVSWDALRTVHAMSEAAGVFSDEKLPRSAILTALARAALEVPNPRTSDLGIDPHKETRKSVLVAAALLYKLKVSATNIVLKFVVRRALARVALRAQQIVPFVAVPVTAAWNAGVTAIVLREARVRIFGPSLARDVVDRLVAVPVSPHVAEAMLRAVGSCVVRTADLHPNLEILLALLRDKLAVSMPSDVESSRVFLASLLTLSDEERALALRTLRAAAVIDGRVARREKQLLVEAGAWSDDVESERKRVVAGEPLALG